MVGWGWGVGMNELTLKSKKIWFAFYTHTSGLYHRLTWANSCPWWNFTLFPCMLAVVLCWKRSYQSLLCCNEFVSLNQKLIIFSSLLFCQFKGFMASWVKAKLFSVFSWKLMKNFCVFIVLSFRLIINYFRLWLIEWGRCLEGLAPTSPNLCFDIFSTSASFKRRTYLV